MEIQHENQDQLVLHLLQSKDTEIEELRRQLRHSEDQNEQKRIRIEYLESALDDQTSALETQIELLRQEKEQMMTTFQQTCEDMMSTVAPIENEESLELIKQLIHMLNIQNIKLTQQQLHQAQRIESQSTAERTLKANSKAKKADPSLKQQFQKLKAERDAAIRIIEQKSTEDVEFQIYQLIKQATECDDEQKHILKKLEATEIQLEQYKATNEKLTMQLRQEIAIHQNFQLAPSASPVIYQHALFLLAKSHVNSTSKPREIQQRNRNVSGNAEESVRFWKKEYTNLEREFCTFKQQTLPLQLEQMAWQTELLQHLEDFLSFQRKQTAVVDSNFVSISTAEKLRKTEDLPALNLETHEQLIHSEIEINRLRHQQQLDFETIELLGKERGSEALVKLEEKLTQTIETNSKFEFEIQELQLIAAYEKEQKQIVQIENSKQQQQLQYYQQQLTQLESELLRTEERERQFRQENEILKAQASEFYKETKNFQKQFLSEQYQLNQLSLKEKLEKNSDDQIDQMVTKLSFYENYEKLYLANFESLNQLRNSSQKQIFKLNQQLNQQQQQHTFQSSRIQSLLKQIKHLQLDLIDLRSEKIPKYQLQNEFEVESNCNERLATWKNAGKLLVFTKALVYQFNQIQDAHHELKIENHQIQEQMSSQIYSLQQQLISKDQKHLRASSSKSKTKTRAKSAPKLSTLSCKCSSQIENLKFQLSKSKQMQLKVEKEFQNQLLDEKLRAEHENEKLIRSNQNLHFQIQQKQEHMQSLENLNRKLKTHVTYLEKELVQFTCSNTQLIKQVQELESTSKETFYQLQLQERTPVIEMEKKNQELQLRVHEQTIELVQSQQQQYQICDQLTLDFQLEMNRTLMKNEDQSMKYQNAMQNLSQLVNEKQTEMLEYEKLVQSFKISKATYEYQLREIKNFELQKQPTAQATQTDDNYDEKVRYYKKQIELRDIRIGALEDEVSSYHQTMMDSIKETTERQTQTIRVHETVTLAKYTYEKLQKQISDYQHKNEKLNEKYRHLKGSVNRLSTASQIETKSIGTATIPIVPDAEEKENQQSQILILQKETTSMKKEWARKYSSIVNEFQAFQKHATHKLQLLQQKTKIRNYNPPTSTIQHLSFVEFTEKLTLAEETFKCANLREQLQLITIQLEISTAENRKLNGRIGVQTKLLETQQKLNGKSKQTFEKQEQIIQELKTKLKQQRHFHENKTQLLTHSHSQRKESEEELIKVKNLLMAKKKECTELKANQLHKQNLINLQQRDVEKYKTKTGELEKKHQQLITQLQHQKNKYHILEKQIRKENSAPADVEQKKKTILNQDKPKVNNRVLRLTKAKLRQKDKKCQNLDLQIQKLRLQIEQLEKTQQEYRNNRLELESAGKLHQNLKVVVLSMLEQLLNSNISIKSRYYRSQNQSETSTEEENLLSPIANILQMSPAEVVLLREPKRKLHENAMINLRNIFEPPYKDELFNKFLGDLIDERIWFEIRLRELDDRMEKHNTEGTTENIINELQIALS